MQLTQLMGETSLSALVKRVFGIEADHPQAKAATAALTAANPQLTGRIAKLPEGTPVVVPAVAGLTQAASADPRLALLLDQIDQTTKAAATLSGSSAEPTVALEGQAGRAALAQTLVATIQKSRTAKAAAADKAAQKAASDSLKQVQAGITAMKRSFGVS